MKLEEIREALLTPDEILLMMQGQKNIFDDILTPERLSIWYNAAIALLEIAGIEKLDNNYDRAYLHNALLDRIHSIIGEG